MTSSRSARKEAVREILRNVCWDPDRNLLKLLKAADEFDGSGASVQRQLLRYALEDPSRPYYGYLRRVFSEIDPEVSFKLSENFFINSQMTGKEVRETARREYHCNIPSAVFMDPSSSCPLRCSGCRNTVPGTEYRLTPETMDSIVRQGKALGIYVYAFTGAEPLNCRRNLLRICESHPDCVFLVFTHGTLIDRSFAEKMRRVGNLIPAVRLEGGEEETDRRHGRGTYRKVRRVLELLREKELFFGISCCCTGENLSFVTSSDYYENLIRTGAYFVWYSQPVPEVCEAPPASPPDFPERREAYRRIRKLRTIKPLPALDFQNDARLFGGCLAGGRAYLHINAAGDIDPCCFVRSMDRNANIYRMTLLDALRSPSFLAYRMEAPQHEVRLQPCPFPENRMPLRPAPDRPKISS